MPLPDARDAGEESLDPPPDPPPGSRPEAGRLPGVLGGRRERNQRPRPRAPCRNTGPGPANPSSRRFTGAWGAGAGRSGCLGRGRSEHRSGGVAEELVDARGQRAGAVAALSTAWGRAGPSWAIPGLSTAWEPAGPSRAGPAAVPPAGHAAVTRSGPGPFRPRRAERACAAVRAEPAPGPGNGHAHGPSYATQAAGPPRRGPGHGRPLGREGKQR